VSDLPLGVSAHLKTFMAALLPPPKRQKVYNGIPEPEKVPVEQSPNVVVQFVSEDDGSALAPAVSLPANVSREDLQSLVNRLTSKVCLSVSPPRHFYSSHIIPKADEPVPFQFHVALPADAVTKESSRIVIAKSIEADVLSHSSRAFSPEDILVVHCSPQSVFRVRPATRCSSSLSGTKKNFPPRYL
jgi:ribosome assembly protein 4